MVSFVGGVVCAFNGFLLPPAIYMRLRSKLVHINSVLNVQKNSRKTNQINDNVLNDDDGISNYTIEIDENVIDSCNDIDIDMASIRDKGPMSRCFVFGLISIMVFGFSTMISTFIFTLVYVSSRKITDH
jgi:hypothetical protein